MRPWLTFFVTLVYPLAVYWALGRFEPRYIAGFVALFAGFRAIKTRETVWMVALAGALLLASTALIGNAALPLKLYPVLVNAVQLAIFGTSLVKPPTVVERLARLHDAHLPPHAVVYTRKVTWLWCGFFVCNGTAALATALWAPTRIWAVYNGLISYILMGLIFAGEYCVRLRVRRAHG